METKNCKIYQDCIKKSQNIISDISFFKQYILRMNRSDSKIGVIIEDEFLEKLLGRDFDYSYSERETELAEALYLKILCYTFFVQLRDTVDDEDIPEKLIEKYQILKQDFCSKYTKIEEFVSVLLGCNYSISRVKQKITRIEESLRYAL